MKRNMLFLLVLILLVPVGWWTYTATYAQQNIYRYGQALTITGNWQRQNYDLVYTVAMSSQQQPNGPLIVYRAIGSDLRTSVAVAALARGPQPVTPVFFPSPDGRFLALLSPTSGGTESFLRGGSLGILSTDGNNPVSVPNPAGVKSLIAHNVALEDSVVWAADFSALYYHTGVLVPNSTGMVKGRSVSGTEQGTGSDEIHRVDLNGHDTLLWHRPGDNSSVRLIGVDHTGALIMTLARSGQSVELLRLDSYQGGVVHSNVLARSSVLATLPPDILPGNVLGVSSDGNAVECERVVSWNPLRYEMVRVGFFGSHTVTVMPPLFRTEHMGAHVTALNRSVDGRIQVMAQTLRMRTDLAQQGIMNVPAQQTLRLQNTGTGAGETLMLPVGGQIVQTFWTKHLMASRVRVVPQDTLTQLMAFRQRLNGSSGRNASPRQQDEWMLESHAGRLVVTPKLPTMCYGSCPHGPTGAPHVSAAILHGVAYVESNWHQFNTVDYRVMGEAPGTPIESFDGGWGEFQQTWGMPPQCVSWNNCRSDISQVEQEQSYNIGVGTASLISAWNGTAGIASNTDPNDPYKANHWFFAVWQYNGAYGNNPNDVPSSQYGQWYPGAPFRTIYEEYVWYFAAHPQGTTNGWTDNYLPGLGSALLPPQSDFAQTSDSFVACVSCTIPDWTAGTYDREWVGMGTDTTTAGYFQAAFNQLGGENVLGLPRDNGGSAAVHSWGNGLVQDFGGGANLPGALLLASGTTTPYWIYGGVWTQYLRLDSGATGCHGYPTSNLTAYSDQNLGTDSYQRQTFQQGYIIWDTSTNAVASDVCA